MCVMAGVKGVSFFVRTHARALFCFSHSFFFSLAVSLFGVVAEFAQKKAKAEAEYEKQCRAIGTEVCFGLSKACELCTISARFLGLIAFFFFFFFFGDCLCHHNCYSSKKNSRSCSSKRAGNYKNKGLCFRL